jgi:tRNA(Arg) A34 adenosine deaminase TadA
MQATNSSNPLSVKFSLATHAGQAEDLQWMKLALQQAELAAQSGEVPIGAVLVLNGEKIAAAHNAPISRNDACAHAEIQTIQQACQAIGNYRLGAQATLYVTLQPCLMCLGAILHARIGRVVVGCAQSRYNGDLGEALAVFEKSKAWHPCRFETACMADESEKLLSGFFKAHRKQREQVVSELASLMHLPNVNKTSIEELARLGYTTPEHFLRRGLDQVACDLALRSSELKGIKANDQAQQQAAILASLCDYFNGEPVRSWKQYL